MSCQPAAAEAAALRLSPTSLGRLSGTMQLLGKGSRGTQIGIVAMRDVQSLILLFILSA